MKKNMLVAYASKYGATKEIAEKIGDVLLQSGEQVDVLPVEAVKDLERYQAVILGSAIYIGKWLKEATEFLQSNEKYLADRPFWLFSSGPSGEGDPIKLVEGKRVPQNLQQTISRIRPRDITVFHGHVNMEKLNTMEKWAIKSVVKKPFGDFRDWNSIVKWSLEIETAMKDE